MAWMSAEIVNIYLSIVYLRLINRKCKNRCSLTRGQHQPPQPGHCSVCRHQQPAFATQAPPLLGRYTGSSWGRREVREREKEASGFHFSIPTPGTLSELRVTQFSVAGSCWCLGKQICLKNLPACRPLSVAWCHANLHFFLVWLFSKDLTVWLVMSVILL